jgi:alkanesulfonate monooxygenase SsuD/methylene tetrahydromethanopterin reductase-like flavin-dependent oxidoreductase (luciferase family)
VSSTWLLLDGLDLSGHSDWALQLSEWIARWAVKVDVLAFGELRSEDAPLDSLALLGALHAPDTVALGALCELGRGRAASIMAREITTVDLLQPGGAALILRGQDPNWLEEAVAVVSALFTEDRANVEGRFERVVDAPNLPKPRRTEGPKLLSWDSSRGECVLRAAGVTRVVDLVELDDPADLELERGGFDRDLLVVLRAECNLSTLVGG